MAILEKEVWVELNGRNLKYFEEKTYDIPRRKDKWGIWNVPRGTKIKIKVEDLTSGSNVKVTKVCDICGKIVPEQLYQSVIKCRNKGDGKDRCNLCGKIESGKVRKINIKFEKTLEYYAKENSMEYLLKEFSDKNEKKPDEIFKSSRDSYLWICSICNSQYNMMVSQRTNGKCNCPYCRGLRVNNTNSFAAIYPKETKEWNYNKNGNISPHSITARNDKKVWWICNLGHEWETRIADRKYNGCPICNQSKGEKRVRCYLETNGYCFDTQKEFDGLLGIKGGLLSYDFYLPKQNILIEYQGEFHDGTAKKQTDEEYIIQQEHDRRKQKYTEVNGINLLEIWYWDFENIELILQSKLI